MWKQLFSVHWKVNPAIPIRPDVKESSWYSEYKRLYLLQNGPATINSNVHHGEQVYDLTFSRSGKYLCTSSKHVVVMWSVGDSIEVFNKLYISCNQDSGEGSKDSDHGLRYTLFNATDEFLLVFGLQMQLDGPNYSDRLFQVLVYTFPDCYLTRTVDWNLNQADANPGWFGRYTFLINERNQVQNDSGFEGKLVVWSVFEQYESKELVNVDYDIEDVAVMNDGSALQKVLVFCYIDDEAHNDWEYSQNAHKITCYVVNSDLPRQDHVCDPKFFCCVESRYRSPDPSHYTCCKHPFIDKHIGASIRQIDDSVIENFGVICRPILETCDHGNIKYSKEKLDLRIFDLKMKLMRVVPLQSMVPPQLYLFEHDYWLDEHLHSLLISGDLYPGLLHYFDLHYNVYIKKNTGHTEGLNYAAFSPNAPFLLCTVSDDNLIKFWDFRKHSK